MTKNLVSVPLKEIVLPVERSEVPLPGKTYRQLGVRLWGEGAYERESIDGIQTNYKTLARVETNDIVVNKIWARNGTVTVIPEELSGCYVSNEFPTFAAIPGALDPRWFYWFTKTASCWNQCDEKSRGTSGKNRIRPEKFLEIKVPLPPLAEQQRIVARIEELAEKIEEVRGLRKRAIEELEILSKSVLNEIFSKKLKAVGWNLQSLDLAAEIARGKFTHRPRNEPRFYGGDIPFIQIGDISNSNQYIRNYTQTLNNEGLKISRLFPVGTVVIAITGATVGATGILSFDSCFPDSIVGVIPRKDFITSEFAYWSLEYFKKTALDEATQTTQPNINLKILNKLKIPIPSLTEQQNIVNILDNLRSKVDRMKCFREDALKEMDALLPAILDKAFKGEL